MNASCSYLPYQQTNAFSKIALDYLAEAPELQPFYQYPVSLEGIKASIAARQQYPTNRAVLVQALQQQYTGYDLTTIQAENLKGLLSENTFTVTTAHQPNIFTGPLYFIYKILHAIQLAAYLREQLPQYHFVPIYYMGSEDADLDELGHIHVNGEKIAWQTEQRGAIGRMNTKGLEKITDRLEKQFGHLPYGQQMVRLCRQAYEGHPNVQEATLYLVNELFKKYGLLVLIPDNASLKRLFEPVVEKELLEQFSSKQVTEATEQLKRFYKVQAGGREINLFYLDDNGARERIETGTDPATKRSVYYVAALKKNFTETEMRSELHSYPERFSANVILRGVFQEMVLPNIAFIGGGGELAYWLELEALFKKVGVPYPMLILRNSFLLLEKRAQQLIEKLRFTSEQLFKAEQDQFLDLITRNTANRLKLEEEKTVLNKLYAGIQQVVGTIDYSLQAHVAALQARSLQHLHKLEAKMLKAEKRHHTDKEKQLKTLRQLTFPGNHLQERTDNFFPFYARYGTELLEVLLKHSFALTPGFGVLQLTDLTE